MTLDEIIAKYGTHELDIDFVKHQDEKTVIYAYCHQHNVNKQFMVNHYLEIIGSFEVIEKQIEEDNDIYIHVASIDKKEDGSYMIGGVGDWLHFNVVSDLIVNELTENAYQEKIDTFINDK